MMGMNSSEKTSRKSWLWLAVLLLLVNRQFVQSQVRPRITARVDTTQPATKAVYHLLAHYLNARPDSIYANPYWNAAELAYYVAQHRENADLAAPFLFQGITARQTFATYQPTVLSIEPVGEKYVARLLLYAENQPAAVGPRFAVEPARYIALLRGSGCCGPVETGKCVGQFTYALAGILYALGDVSLPVVLSAAPSYGGQSQCLL
jgi:hypothetical protein